MDNIKERKKEKGRLCFLLVVSCSFREVWLPCLFSTWVAFFFPLGKFPDTNSFHWTPLGFSFEGWGWIIWWSVTLWCILRIFAPNSMGEMLKCTEISEQSHKNLRGWIICSPLKKNQFWVWHFEKTLCKLMFICNRPQRQNNFKSKEQFS